MQKPENQGPQKGGSEPQRGQVPDGGGMPVFRLLLAVGLCGGLFALMLLLKFVFKVF